MKKVIMGVLSVLPGVFFIAGLTVNKIIYSELEKYGYDSLPDGIVRLYTAGTILIAAAVLFYIGAVITYLVYNWKNLYITHDKKIGWGYMIVCIGVVAMPAYWYNFIRK